MVIAAVLGMAGGLVLFYVRATRKEPVIHLGTIFLLSIPEFLWALFFILLFGVALAPAAIHRPADQNLSPPGGTGFLLADALIAGRSDIFWSAMRHMILPCLALGIAFSPTIMRVLRSSL